jgi:O-glycosyl hydrolase
MLMAAALTATGAVIAAIGCGNGNGGSNPAGTSAAAPSPIVPPASSGAPAAGQTIAIDTRALYQVIDGFGTTQRLFDDPHVTETFDPVTMRAAVVVPPAEQQKILAALHTELGLTRVRYNQRDDPGAASGPVGIEPVNDNADPQVTDLSKFNFSWKNNDGHIELVKRQLPLGVTSYFASALTLESFMNESNPQEYVEWAMAILRRWREQGLEMPFYSIVNEPGYRRSGLWSGEWLREVTKLLGAKLRAEGFGTRIVIPDDVSPAEAYKRASIVLADPAARQYVGAIAYHLYDDRSNRDRLKALGESYGIPIWMTEFAFASPFEWADLIHDQIVEYGTSAVDMQWGFFGQYEPTTSHLVTINHSGNTYTGFTRTKSFHTMGQFSRFVKPGARRVGVNGAPSGLRVSAYLKGSEVVVVAIAGHGAGGRTVTFEVLGTSCAGSVEGTRTSANEDSVSVAPVAVAGNRFQVPLPDGSVSTYRLACGG